MPNMAVQYRGPNPALLTLTKELRARFGDPARTYEFVTGYKSPDNYSGHNPDQNGIVHAVDIFVGPGNLTAAQGVDTAERIRQEGQRGETPGVPARVFYLIHNRRIAGGSEGWAWRPYTGADPHTDHIHVSTADTYWGDPVALDASNYNTTAPWNLWAAVPLTSTKPTPIQEDDMSAADVTAIKNHINAVLLGGYEWGGKKHPGIGAVVEENQRRIGAIPANVWATPVARSGKKVTALQELADAKTESIKSNATLIALQNVIGQLAGGSSVDYAKVTEAVTKALAEGVVKVDVTVAGADQ